MKTLRRLVPCLLMLVATAQTAGARDTVEDVQTQVRSFYRWYVHALNTDPGKEPRKTATVRRYVSTRFLKEIARRSDSEQGLESDPFLCGQDWDPDWEKNIRVKDMDPEGTRWMVEVEFSGKQITSHRVRLGLVSQGSSWKIDKASDADTH